MSPPWVLWVRVAPPAATESTLVPWVRVALPAATETRLLPWVRVALPAATETRLLPWVRVALPAATESRLLPWARVAPPADLELETPPMVSTSWRDEERRGIISTGAAIGTLALDFFLTSAGATGWNSSPRRMAAAWAMATAMLALVLVLWPGS